MNFAQNPHVRWHPAGTLSGTKDSRSGGTIRAARFKLTLMKIIALLSALALASCVTTETTAPDGTVTRIKAPAPGSIELAGQALQVIGSRNVEKSSK